MTEPVYYICFLNLSCRGTLLSVFIDWRTIDFNPPEMLLDLDERLRGSEAYSRRHAVLFMLLAYKVLDGSFLVTTVPSFTSTTLIEFLPQKRSLAVVKDLIRS